MKDEKITIRLDRKELDYLTNVYANNTFYKKISFSEFIRQKLKEGENEKWNY